MRRLLQLAPPLLAPLLLSSAVMAQAQPAPPTTAELEAPEYPPPSARWKVVTAGLGTTAVAYGAAVGASYVFPDTPGTSDLRIPIAGPWLAIAHNGCPADEPDCSKAVVVLRSIVSAIDGIAQAGGLAIALEGLFMPTEVRSYAPAPRLPAPAPSPTPSEPNGVPSSPSSPSPTNGGGKNLFFIPTPMNVGERGVGFGVVGRF